ncbi:MAG TPA: hypothetical protein VG798_01200 [Rhizomicrobium sp.]|nr:hypothetical protein [Rhizomicrobium sp.]
MFEAGTSWQKKVLGTGLLYFALLALGCLYSSRIFHDNKLGSIGIGMVLIPALPLIIWARYKRRRDAEFAARMAASEAAKSTTLGKARANLGQWAIIAYHILFLAGVFAIKFGLDRSGLFGNGRDAEIFAATAAATALAAAPVMWFTTAVDKRLKERAQASGSAAAA